MKKIKYILLIILSFTLIACTKTFQGLILDKVTIVNVNLIEYDENNNREVITITFEEDDLIEFKEKINAIKYQETYPCLLNVKYEIVFDDVIIFVSDKKEFSICKDGIEEFYHAVIGDFSFLDDYEYKVDETIYLKDMLLRDEYGLVELTKVSIGKTVDISKNLMFLEKINSIKLNEVNVGAGVDEYKYIITFHDVDTEDVLSLYVLQENLIKLKGRHYELYDETFAFLDEIEFNSTGWMPWV